MFIKLLKVATSDGIGFKPWRGATTVILGFLCVLSLLWLLPQRSVHALTVGDIRVSELMPDPAAVADSNGEWVELVNNSQHEVSLVGLREEFINAAGEVVGVSTFASGSLQPGEVFVHCRNPLTHLNGGVVCNRSTSALQLGNSGGGVRLVDEASGAVLDQFYFQSELVESGKSINASCGGGMYVEDQDTFGNGDYGTPGKSLLGSARMTVTDKGEQQYELAAWAILPGHELLDVKIDYAEVGSNEWHNVTSMQANNQLTEESVLVSWDASTLEPGEYTVRIAICSAGVTCSDNRLVTDEQTVSITADVEEQTSDSQTPPETEDGHPKHKRLRRGWGHGWSKNVQRRCQALHLRRVELMHPPSWKYLRLIDHLQW